MNIIQNSSGFVVSCVMEMQRAVTLEADKELKWTATRDESDRSNGEADYEELKPLFQSSVITSNSNLPPTTSLINEKQVLEISEKSDVSDLVLEEQELGSKSSKQTDSPLAPVISESVQNTVANSSIQS